MLKRSKAMIIFVIAVGILWLIFGQREINYPYGRDSMFVINDGKYQVQKSGVDDVILRCYKDVPDSNVILEDIRNYRSGRHEAYIYSDHGFAVVYEDNTCKLFLTYDEEEMEQGYTITEKGYKHDFMRGIKYAYPDVELLDSFDEFTEEEQKELLKLQEETVKEDMEKETNGQ